MMLNPYGTQDSQMAPFSGSDLLSCRGMEAAMNLRTYPNTRFPVFDADDDIFYMVKTDQNNNKEYVKRYRFVEEPLPKPEDLYASKEEFKELKGEIQNVQQSISELLSAIKRDGEAKYNTSNGKHKAE